MTGYFIYLLQTSVCMCLIYTVYVTLFRRTTFFQLNRLYLVSGLVLSFVIPALDISMEETDYPIMPLILGGPIMDYSVADDHGYQTEALTGGGGSVAMTIFAGAYLFVAFILFLRLARNVVQLVQLRRGTTRELHDGVAIVRAKTAYPFSFMNTVFLPENMDNPLIVAHEKEHIRQRHWVDLAIVELAGVVLWFNPVMMLFRRSLKVLHEYQADAGTLRSSFSVENYLSCLLHQVHPAGRPGPVSLFFSNTLKNRIIMMTKNKTSRVFLMLYAAALPALALLISAFSIKQQAEQYDPASATDAPVTVVVDPAHGGTDKGASGADGSFEKFHTLAVAKQIRILGEKQGIRVILTRDTDVNLSLADRADLAKEHNADLFISLHVDSDEDKSKKGMSCIISKNDHFDQSRKFVELVGESLRRLKGISYTGIREGNPYVLKHNTAPAMIVEMGYLSNSDDLGFISKPGNQERIAGQIVQSILHFKKH